MMTRSFSIATKMPLLAVLLAANPLSFAPAAENFELDGVAFPAMRKVSLSSEESSKAVVVVPFYHQGWIDLERKNVVAATDRKRTAVPTRILQIGPGDYCRLAFRPNGETRQYVLLFGGDHPLPTVPAWQKAPGLLLETRRWVACNLDDFDSVRDAFEKAKPIGADYVSGVHQSRNPFALEPAPFLSRYTGTLRVKQPGKYGFFTASQDCSFLRIDDETIVAAPGRHGPARRADPEKMKTLSLSAGDHDFEYHHAASSNRATMLAAWVMPDNQGKKPKPEVIPPEAFGVGAIADVLPGPILLADEPLTPDFLFEIEGDVPLPDNPDHLVGVQMIHRSPSALRSGGRVKWHFGDGQTSDRAEPVHVYLRPGLYTVTLEATRLGNTYRASNRIRVAPPYLPRNIEKERLHDLDTYLPILETYDPAKLDAPSLLQLVRVWQYRWDQLAAEAKSDETEAQKEQRRANIEAVQQRIVALGKVAVAETSAAKEKEALFAIAESTAPVARDHLLDPRSAGQIWHGAARKIAQGTPAAQCLGHAADIAVTDLLDRSVGKMLLESAEKVLPENASGRTASLLQRILGDFEAASGNGEKAREAYRRAAELQPENRSFVQRTAREGSLSRSAEGFLRDGNHPRAVAVLRQWRDAFPESLLAGDSWLLFAKYWKGVGHYRQASAMAERLLTIDADSPFADQILLVAAEAEVADDRLDRARALLQSILVDYPGSPLVPQVEERLENLPNP